MQWESLNGSKGWLREMKHITQILQMPTPDNETIYDLEMVHSKLMKLTRSHWWADANTKSKLEYYVLFKDQEDPCTIVKANLDRRERSLLTQLVSGILPIEKEVGRYTNVKKELRFCKICNVPRTVEDEYHFLFDCAPLQYERSMFYVNHIENVEEFMLLNDHMKVKYLLTKDMVKCFAEWVVAMFDKRKSIIYKPS